VYVDIDAVRLYLAGKASVGMQCVLAAPTVVHAEVCMTVSQHSKFKLLIESETDFHAG
jgi:hypothetical protein